jgi:hypothetical protein
MPNRFAGIKFQRISKLEQLHGIHTPLPLLDSGHVGLRAPNSIRHCLLRQAELIPPSNKEIAQRQVPRGGEGPWHAALLIKKTA